MLLQLPQRYITYLRSRVLWILGISLKEISIHDPRILKDLVEDPNFHCAVNLYVHVPTGHSFYIAPDKSTLLVRESSAWEAIHASSEHGYVSKNRKFYPLDTDFHFVIPISRNYYHWMFDELPFTLYTLDYDKSNLVKYIHCGQLKPYQVDMINHLNISTRSSVEWIRPKKILIPKQRHISGQPTLQVLEKIRSCCPPIRAEDEVHKRKIYISRKRSSRALPDETEIEYLLKSIGFEVLYLEDLNLATQISYFQKAEIIIAPHGAGLANLVWSNPGTRLIELMPDNFYNPCFANLASILDLEYRIFSYSNWREILRIL